MPVVSLTCFGSYPSAAVADHMWRRLPICHSCAGLVWSPWPCSSPCPRRWGSQDCDEEARIVCQLPTVPTRKQIRHILIRVHVRHMQAKLHALYKPIKLLGCQFIFGQWRYMSRDHGENYLTFYLFSVFRMDTDPCSPILASLIPSRLWSVLFCCVLLLTWDIY